MDIASRQPEAGVWPTKGSGDMLNIKTILHPTDFSPNSRYAFETACTLARDNRATLVVLHVMAPSTAPVLQVPPPDLMRSAESQQTVGQFPWPQPSDPQIRVEHRVTDGDPGEEILRAAEQLPCDIIVMGTHGRTGLGRLLTGSVAEEVLRKASCPVLVVRTPSRAAPDGLVESMAGPGDVIDARPLGPAIRAAATRTLFRSGTLQLVRLIVKAGQEIAQHESGGEIVVHCLEGRVNLRAQGKTQTLEAGMLVELPPGEPHSLAGVEDAAILLTIIRAEHR
jgi:nucleotide-binding universal stress UspA family protein/mannose-6-phosphate isomerase-like protein (cupin superfamily)